MELEFNKIENADVFTRDFSPLTRYNQIDFPTSEEIAVIYGPNGTGKTSLIKVLSDATNTKLEFVYNGTTYTSGTNVFHVVNDQNNRNIISGETRDFFLGDNIQHEFELQDLLAEKRSAFISAVLSILKGYKITTTKHPLSDLIEDETLKGFVKHCFKLYLLNNTDGEVNGFIPLRTREQDMLISLEKLLESFRTDVPKKVQNFELYLISMIPFMRGYANIANKRDIFESLTQVMQGYKTENVDIAQAYIDLFGNPDGCIPSSYSVTVADILLKSVDAVAIVDTNSFPLLNRTLKHSFQYLSLRLAVEKALVDKFNIDTSRYSQLGQIISAAYPDETDIEQIRNRIRLTSKKTLINEFNHFEGNLSIFQPAIDITNQALSREKADLMTFIENL